MLNDFSPIEEIRNLQEFTRTFRQMGISAEIVLLVLETDPSITQETNSFSTVI